MWNSWQRTLRRLAAASVVSIATAWSSAMCYAVQLAYDVATNLAYQDDDSNAGNDGDPMNNTNGWQAGDNSGFGFTAWNFDSRHCFNGVCDPQNYTKPGIKFIDDGQRLGTHYSNPFNNIGAPATGTPPSTRTWGMGTTPDSTGLNTIGRGIPALQPNQTISLVVDNPTDRRFYKGYFIRLNSANGPGGNICYGGAPCTSGAAPVNKLTWWRFDYFDYGVWKVGDGAGDATTSLNDLGTAVAGMKFDFTLTGADAYTLTVTPLANPGNSYTRSGTLRNPGTPLDWIEFVFFNTNTDTGTLPTKATDFYIRSMEITGPAPPGVPGDYNKNGVVDGADYVLWRNGGPLQNEVDTPGTVNAADYTEWRARFGNTSGAGSGNIAPGAVPEPGTFVFLVGAIGGWAAVRSRKRLRRCRD